MNNMQIEKYLEKKNREKVAKIEMCVSAKLPQNFSNNGSSKMGNKNFYDLKFGQVRI